MRSTLLWIILSMPILLVSCLSSSEPDVYTIYGNTSELSEAEVPHIIELGDPQSTLPSMSEMNPGRPTQYSSHRLAQFPVDIGEPSWSVKTGSRIVSQVIKENDRVYFTNRMGELYAVHADTGEILFRFISGGDSASSPYLFQDSLYLQDRAGYLIEINKMTGEETRRIRLQENSRRDEWDYYLSTPVVHQNRIYLGSGRSRLYCIDRDSFQVLWAIEGLNRVHSTVQFQGDRAYFSDMGGNLVSIDSRSGEIIWNVKCGNAIMGDVAIGHNKVFIGSRNCRVHALDSETGEELWNRSYGSGWIMATPVVHENLLLVSGSDGYFIQALDLENGEERWIQYVKNNVAGTPVVHNGRLYVQAGDAYNTRGMGGLLIFDVYTGEPKGRFRSYSSFSSPYVEGNQAFFANDIGEFFMVDLNLFHL